MYILFTETSLRWSIFVFALWPFAFQPLSKDHLQTLCFWLLFMINYAVMVLKACLIRRILTLFLCYSGILQTLAPAFLYLTNYLWWDFYFQSRWNNKTWINSLAQGGKKRLTCNSKQRLFFTSDWSGADLQSGTLASGVHRVTRLHASVLRFFSR